MNATIDRYTEKLASLGATYDGGSERSRGEIAVEWEGYFGERVRLAESYMDAGCWDAMTAHLFREAGITPDRLEDVGSILGHDDPVYAACNGDLSVSKVIEAIEDEAN
jgi:hypothetical protein